MIDLSPSTSDQYQINAGVDVNDDGVLENDEVARTIDVHVVSGKLGVVESDGSELAHSQQNTQGGYVMLNDDDDSYAFDSAGNLLPDASQTNIPTEHDLVPLKLHAEDNPAFGGKYTLLTTSSNIKIWKEPTKITAVDSSTTFDASQNTTVYVEGIAESSAAAAEQINLRWSLPGLTPMNLDTAAYTVYKLEGVMNVPGYSSYQYTADVPGGIKGTANWSSPANGTISSQAGGGGSAQILWGSGPVVGKVFFSPAPGFVGELDVNVVQISVLAGGSNNIAYNNPPSQLSYARITSDANTDAIVVALTVDTIAGPMVDGKMRGVKFMELGFIQNTKFTSKSGDFDQLPKASGNGNGRRRQSSLQDGLYHLDICTAEPNPSVSPWYDSTNITGDSAIPGFLGNLTDDNALHDLKFDMSDKPIEEGSDVVSLTEGGVTADINRVNILADFNLYFAVRTTESVNGSDKVYTARESASWHFDGSGSFSGLLSRWSSNTANNGGSSAFTQIADGTAVPITTGTPANDLIDHETWSTIDQP